MVAPRHKAGDLWLQHRARQTITVKHISGWPPDCGFQTVPYTRRGNDPVLLARMACLHLSAVLPPVPPALHPPARAGQSLPWLCAGWGRGPCAGAPPGWSRSRCQKGSCGQGQEEGKVQVGGGQIGGVRAGARLRICGHWANGTGPVYMHGRAAGNGTEQANAGATGSVCKVRPARAVTILRKSTLPAYWRRRLLQAMVQVACGSVNRRVGR